ncbi:MAG: hypothetical protein JWO36_5470 [Myxococcales bacterium]|nr:hypothetical protein [Myxococcales bacterium]
MRPGVIKLSTDRAWYVPALFFVVGTTAAIIGAIILVGELRGSPHGPVIAGAVIADVVGGLIGYLGAAAWLNGGVYVLIDVPAGTLHHVAWRRPTACMLGQLGPLEIRERTEKTRTAGNRYTRIVYELRAPGIANKILFESQRREAVEHRRAEIELYVAQSALRRVLAAPAIEGGALRDAPELVSSAKRAAGDRLVDAIVALERDIDPQVAQRARELRAAADN